MRKFLFWGLIAISLIAIFFNTGLLINTAVSRKYEVDHPRITHGNDDTIDEKERELNRTNQLSLAIYVVCLAGISGGIYGLVKSKRIKNNENNHEENMPGIVDPK